MTGMLGSFYGILMLKVAKLGFKRGDMRSMAGRVGMFMIVNGVTSAATYQLFSKIDSQSMRPPI